jgi:hypothetical protein
MHASTLLSWVALWALGFVRAYVRARTGGCGSGSSLTPGQLVFERDMTHDIRFQANWDRIKIISNTFLQALIKENINRIRQTYNVGDRILLRKPGLL